MAEQRVEAVERALTILEAFREGHESLTLAEIAKATGFYKSTILRLIGSLERFGYLRRREDGRYQLGPSLWRLGSLYRRNFDLGEHIRPELRRLVEETGETASFYVREGEQRVCLYRQNSPQPMRHHLDEGVRLTLDQGAAGRVLLAHAGASGAPYDAVRTDGWYASLGERDSNIAAVAVPLFDGVGSLRGALAVSGLITRFDERARLAAVAALKESAKRLSPLLPRE
ncbi:MAG: IclR family transcriptional regulator [Methyloligellaceae bacterium]